MMLISILMMIAGGALIILDLFVLNIPSVLCAIDVIFLLVYESVYY